MLRRATALLVLLACKAQAPASPPSEPGTPQSAAAACVDAQLAARGLNSFGDPQDTNYSGGTPLFDEKSGKARDRVEYVLSRHPEIAAACARDGG